MWMRCSSKDRSDRSFSFSEATLQRQEWNTNQPHAFVDVMTLMSIRLWIADAVPNGEGPNLKKMAAGCERLGLGEGGRVIV